MYRKIRRPALQARHRVLRGNQKASLLRKKKFAVGMAIIVLITLFAIGSKGFTLFLVVGGDGGNTIFNHGQILPRKTFGLEGELPLRG